MRSRESARVVLSKTATSDPNKTVINSVCVASLSYQRQSRHTSHLLLIAVIADPCAGGYLLAINANFGCSDAHSYCIA